MKQIISKKGVAFSIVAAFFSVFLISIIYALNNIVPFGDNTMLVHDMDIQYSAFLMWFSNVLHGRTSFVYSLQGGLGEGTIGLYSYYLGSPLNLLFFFANTYTLPLVISLVLMLKIGLSAFNMGILLNRKSASVFSIVFCCFYALSSYVIDFQYNIMWMDAYYLLPLVVLGLELLLEKKSGLIYAIALGLCVWCNYYIGFMVCLFCVVLFVSKIIDTNDNLRQTGRFVIYSLLGGCLSAIALIPEALFLGSNNSNRMVALSDLVDFEFIISPIKEVKYLFPGSFDAGQGIFGRYPMLYAGTVTVFLCIIFFVSAKVRIREKLSVVFVFAILFLGMFSKGPFLIWHGMSVPSGCYERNAFLWVFFAVLIGYKAYCLLDKKDWKEIVIGLFFVCGLYAVAVFCDGFRLVYIAEIFIIISYIVIKYICFVGGESTALIESNTYILPRKQLLISYIAISGLLLLCGADLVYNGVRIHKTEFVNDDGSKKYHSYSLYKDEVGLFDELSKSITSNIDCQRVAIWGGFGNSFNKGRWLGVNGMNQYSSSDTEDTWKIYSIYGQGLAKWESDIEFDGDATALICDLFGVKYLFEDDAYEVKGYSSIANSRGISLYENPDALPAGFLVNESALSIPENLDEYLSENDRNNLFALQNDIYHSLYGSCNDDIYEIIDSDSSILESRPDYARGKEPQIYKLSEDMGDLYLEKYDEDLLYTDGKLIAKENGDILSKTVSSLKKYTKEISSESKVISGKFIVPEGENSYICITIPCADGIKTYVNGKRVEPISGMGGFVLVPAIDNGNGECIVEIEYVTPGMWIGCIISILSIIVLVIIGVIDKKRLAEEKKSDFSTYINDLYF